MKKCCKETFKKSLEEVIIFINVTKPKNVDQVLATIEYAILELEREQVLHDKPV